ncbi:Mur ligase family protein [Georgenia sp. SYP-B2076]|uniref:Mur ligase family protein n=1 Tax=Georgenia sp. SYP-B2076 TaxID=2495881 RepID=UPI001F0CB3A1|nr:Mur ligase family protein [Georgenia sp. SYP-B2076]
MRYAVVLGKAVRWLTRLRGGGSALPGLVIERLDGGFTPRTLAQLPQGVAVVSGTNGKTTTTKMVAALLASQGLRVFTNRSGSNWSRGVAAALLGEVDTHGRLAADIAVLELDEAHAVPFVASTPPRFSLLLNVARDQLDRFGEVDTTARLLERTARSTFDTVILNREDPRVAVFADRLPATTKVRFFGLSDSLRATFPSDDDLYAAVPSAVVSDRPADVTLDAFDEEAATFTVAGQPYRTAVMLQGVYNAFNAAAALSLARAVLGDSATPRQLVDALADIAPAFGRGERLLVDGLPLELVLVKNPSGFRLGLQSFAPKGHATMIAINDSYPDGRDTSWLWDVECTGLRDGGVLEVSGVRAYDMALRLQYDEVAVGHVTTDLSRGLRHFLEAARGRPKCVYCTYTAMLALRRELAKLTEVEAIS